MYKDEKMFVVYGSSNITDVEKLKKFSICQKITSNNKKIVRATHIHVVVASDGSEAIRAIRTIVSKIDKSKPLTFVPHRIIDIDEGKDVVEEVTRLFTNEYSPSTYSNIQTPVIYNDPTNGKWTTLVKPLHKLRMFNNIKNTYIHIINGKDGIILDKYDLCRITYSYFLKDETIHPHWVYTEDKDDFSSIFETIDTNDDSPSERFDIFFIDGSCSLDYIIDLYNYTIDFFSKNNKPYDNFTMIGRMRPYGELIDLKKVSKNILSNGKII